MNEENIKRQYQEHEKDFEGIKSALSQSLQNIASAFYQKTRFNVTIPEPRLKPIDSVISKMKRKGIDSDSLFTSDEEQLSLVVNDFLGARIVCNTREDVNEIKALFNQHPRFKVLKEETHDKPSGYRAVHLDVLYHIYWKDVLLYIPVEIQLKTQLQNAWADITHDESYKPENEDYKNEWERAYSKHMADVLDTLDNMASTIRKQRLSDVKPPQTIDDSDTVINSKTLSYKIDSLKKGERLTQQEMTLAIRRLEEEGFGTLAEAWELLQDSAIESRIKKLKEQLRNDQNVTPFEMLYYGSILKRGDTDKFEGEMTREYGFVQNQCLDCNRLLTTDEYDFIKGKTDSDVDFYCIDHRKQHFPNKCPKCETLTAGQLCKNCEAEVPSF
jgi:ppGpp synthetase/RelA/SpoT-type nucleotidyltranferase